MLVESRGSSEEGYVIVIICAVRGARHGHQRAGHTQAARTRAGLGASLRRMKKRCLRSGDPTLDRSIELMKTKRVPGGSCLFQGYDRSRSQLPACALHACLRVSIPLHALMYVRSTMSCMECSIYSYTVFLNFLTSAFYDVLVSRVLVHRLLYLSISNSVYNISSLRTPPRHPPTPAPRPRSANQVGGVRGREYVKGEGGPG